MKVHTRDDGKRYVDMREVIDDELRRIKEEEQRAMPPPTIDDMVEFLDFAERSAKANPPVGFKQEFLDEAWSEADKMLKAVRAILEQQRDTVYLAGHHDLRVIRAFVERVEKRWQQKGAPYWSAVDEELAALESESNEPSALSPY